MRSNSQGKTDTSTIVVDDSSIEEVTGQAQKHRKRFRSEQHGEQCKGGKKKKISKAERLRLQQEEEEKRLKEEEEARLKFEKEEQERLETQRIENEKWHQLEKKDLERRQEELEELYLLEGCFPEAEKWRREVRAVAQWRHYILCDGSPDPSIAQEINTFISLWKEETKETFEEVLEKSKLVLSLIDKLKLTLVETPPCDLGSKTTAQYQESIRQLQELLRLKFNVATELLLRQASNLADLDSGNMEKIIQDENITLYVWANLKKNPRCRSIRFSETQVGFEIPRILATSDIALRVMHTRYDHITPMRPVSVHSEDHITTVVELVRDDPCTAIEAVETPEIKAKDEDEDEAEAEVEEQQEPKENREFSIIPKKETKLEVLFNPEEHRVSVQEASEAMKCGLDITLLREAVSTAQLYLVENSMEKPEVTVSHQVDLLQFHTLGGVYHLDVLELPPQCKPVKGWVIVEILKEGLQNFTYPPEATEEPDPENAFPPIEVMLCIHEDVLFFEDPMVTRWDAEGQHWSTEGVSNVSYDREERLVTFSLDTFGPVALTQDAHINMPYQSWELTPLDVNKALLTVTTVFTEIQIHIKDNFCMLASIKLDDQENPLNLEGKWMTPVPFIMALKDAGLNIFPTTYSHFYVIINSKMPQVELKAYRQMALLSSAFSFGWSKWNTYCSHSRVIFKVKEQLPEEQQDCPWSLLLFSGERVQELRLTEESEVFSESLKENTELHSTLYHMVKDFASETAMNRVRSADCKFVDSVCHMLLSTRLLSYS